MSSGSASGSEAESGPPTLVPCGEFSGTDRLLVSAPKTGGRLVTVVPWAGFDQGLWPSWLLASTRTWYSVPGVRSVSVMDSPVPSCSASLFHDDSGSVTFRYSTS